MTHIFSGDFEEKQTTSTRETWDFVSGKFSAKRMFIGPWANRFQFLEDELVDSITDIAGNTIFSTLAPYPDNPIAILAKVDIIGKGKSSTNPATLQAQWERAEITVEYSTIPSQDEENQDNSDPGNYAQMIGVEESGSHSVEALSIPGEDLKAGGIRQQDQGPFNIPTPLGTIGITFPRLSRPNFALADMLMGSVNDTAFITPGGRAFPSGTIRFDGYDDSIAINVTVLPNGSGIVDPTRLWNVTWKFGFNFWGWNNRLIDGVWQAVVFNNGQKIHRENNLFQLFFGVDNYGFAKGTLDNLDTQLQTLYSQGRAGNSYAAIQGTLNNIISIMQGLGFNV